MKSYFKSFILALALIMCLGASTIMVANPEADAAGSLVAQYKLNGDCKDASGNGNDGTVVGDVSFADDSVVGKCAVFNGGCIEVNSSPGLNLGSQFSITVWVKVDPVMATPINKNGPIISKLDDRGIYNNYNFYTRGKFGFRADTRTNAGERSVVNGPFTDLGLSNAWSQFVFSCDGKFYYVYHNGELKATKDIGSGNSILSSANKMRIGTGNDLNNTDLYYKGRMADLRIYNYALSPAEIKTLYSNGTEKIQTPAANEIKVVINGQLLQSEVKPFVNADGRTMLPLRAIAEALGAEVQWDGSTQTATLTQGANIVKVPIGQRTMTVNNNQVPIDTAATVIDGRTLLPVRAIGEALGAQIGWDPATKTVNIASAGQ